MRPRDAARDRRRNGYALPSGRPSRAAALYEFRDFAHFVEVWILTRTPCGRSDDFRQVVVDYAAEAKRHGAVYVEGIFSPRRVGRGSTGTRCSAATATARRRRGAARARGAADAGHPARLHGGAGGDGRPAGGEVPRPRRRRRRPRRRRGRAPAEPYEPAFALARSEGLGSVPHAGEIAGPASIRGALDVLGADRIRHGIRAVEDPELVRGAGRAGDRARRHPGLQPADRRGASLDEHPLPRLVAEGVLCSISTDDPVMFGTDLTREYELAAGLGLDPRASTTRPSPACSCGDALQERLRELGKGAWEGPVRAGRGRLPGPVARAATKRNRRPAAPAAPPRPEAAERSDRPSRTRCSSAALRNHAKWVFVLLAVGDRRRPRRLRRRRRRLGFGDLLKNNSGGGSRGAVDRQGARRTTQEHPKDAQAWSDLGQAYELKGQTATRSARGRRYTKLRPKNVDGLRPPRRALLGAVDERRRTTRRWPRPRRRRRRAARSAAHAHAKLGQALASQLEPGRRRPPRRAPTRATAMRSTARRRPSRRSSACTGSSRAAAGGRRDAPAARLRRPERRRHEDGAHGVHASSSSSRPTTPTPVRASADQGAASAAQDVAQG